MAAEGLARTTVSNAYNRPDHWQQLTLSDIPNLLAAQLRVMRAMPGVTIDSREAFVDSVVLVVPGDPHGVEVLTDDLEVDGILLANTEEIQLTSHAASQRLSAGPTAAAIAAVTAAKRR